MEVGHIFQRLHYKPIITAITEPQPDRVKLINLFHETGRARYKKPRAVLFQNLLSWAGPSLFENQINYKNLSRGTYKYLDYSEVDHYAYRNQSMEDLCADKI